MYMCTCTCTCTYRCFERVVVATVVFYCLFCLLIGVFVYFIVQIKTAKPHLKQLQMCVKVLSSENDDDEASK